MKLRLATFLSCLLIAGAATAKDNEDSFRVGGTVEIQDTTVGALHIVAGTVSVNAPVHGDLYVVGGDVSIDATVNGDVHVVAGTLNLGPKAQIAGELNFIGGNLNADAASTVAGETDHLGGPNWRGNAAHEVESRLSEGWGWTAFLVVMAALLAAALPGATRGLTRELTTRPWQAPLLGFLAMTAIPVFAVLLCVTIIGIPAALITALLYVVLLMAGYVSLAVVIGGLLLDRFSAETAAVTAWRVGAAVTAMLVIAILVRVPYLGGVLKFAVVVVGVGMIVGAVVRRKEAPQSVIPA